MGRYSTRVRYGDALVGLGGSSGTVMCPKSAEFVYSYRTGFSGSDSELPSSVTGNAYNGVRMPLKKGPLPERIKDRQRFYRDLDQTLGGERHKAAGTPFASRADTGHSFTSIKWTSTRQGRQEQLRNGVVTIDVPVVGSLGALVPDELPTYPAFRTYKLSSVDSRLATPGSLERQARVNSAMEGMIPHAPIGSIAETVISLMRGEFPSVMKNINKMMRFWERKWTDIPKYTGGEYLNSVFGWQPLIRDFENAIKVLFAVDSLVFGTAYRRHRLLKFPDVSFEVVSSEPLTALNAYPVPGMGQSGTSSSAYNVSTQVSRPYTKSYHRQYSLSISARLFPIARPTRGANRFTDEVEDKLQLLGAWTPSLGWDLLPYSWLVDWFIHLGDSINNAFFYGSRPGMTNIDYAYATSVTRTLEEVHFTAGWHDIGTTTRRRQSGVPQALTVVKHRVPISPFGLGIDLSQLSADQVQILMALGLAKIP